MPQLALKWFLTMHDNLPVFLAYFPCLTSRTERTSASED
jgi:hypothetical protein